MEVVESNVEPNETSSKEEVKLFFTSWLDGKYKNIFNGYDGKTLLGLSKQDLKDALGGLDGSALYNVLHPHPPQGESRYQRSMRGQIPFENSFLCI
jgi:hypothetical protein